MFNKKAESSARQPLIADSNQMLSAISACQIRSESLMAFFSLFFVIWLFCSIKTNNFSILTWHHSYVKLFRNLFDLFTLIIISFSNTKGGGGCRDDWWWRQKTGWSWLLSNRFFHIWFSPVLMLKSKLHKSYLNAVFIFKSLLDLCK